MSAVSTPTKASSAPQPRQRWVVWALLFILLLALGTDLIFYTGFYASDDLQYIRGATELAETGRLSSITLGTIRLPLVVPLAIAARVTDYDLFLMAALFIFYHLLAIVGTYWLGSLIHDRHTGVLASGFMAVCPLGSLFATMIMPDHPVTAMSLLSVGCLLVGTAKLTADSPYPRVTWVLFGLSGFLFVVACAAKVVAIILLPVLLLVLACCLRRAPGRAVLRAALLFALGGGLAALILWAAFYMATGLHSPLQDAGLASLLNGSERVAAKPYNAPADRLQRLVSFGTHEAYLGLFTWAVLLAIIGYPIVRRRSWGLYLTLVWVCAYMTWGSFSLTRYMPPPMQIRYFIFALPPMMVMSAFVIVTVVRPVWSRAANRNVARRALVGLGAILCLLVVADSCTLLNHRAGRAYFADLVAGTRYTLDLAGQSDTRPVVLSAWLSGRMHPLLHGADEKRVIQSNTRTDVGNLAVPLRSGMLYVDCTYEHALSGDRQSLRSPFDLAVQNALAGGDESLDVRTLTAVGQFKTRLSALRYMYGGARDHLGLRDSRRQVFLREVRAVQHEADPLDLVDAAPLDLRSDGIWSPAWIHRLERCDVTVSPDGSLDCQVRGSEDRTGGQYGGVRLSVGPIKAVRLDVTFQNPDQINAVFLDLTVGTSPNNRLRWEYIPSDDRGLAEGRRTYTFRPDQRTGGFLYVGGPAALDEVDTAQFFIRLKGQNARAGFRIHRVLVER